MYLLILTQISEILETKRMSDLKAKRYHTWSDFDYTREHYIKYFKIFATILILRELPLKNFYARCFVVGACLHYFNYHWWRLGYQSFYYMNERDNRQFENYPRLREIVTKRISSRHISPTKSEADYWWQFQSPLFYHHHHKHYRYIFREKREVPWDGTYNQPIFPYHTLNDRTAFVHSGTLESVEPKPSSAW